MSDPILETLATALGPYLNAQKARQYGVGRKHDITGTPVTNQYMHGPEGMLTFPGVDPAVFQAIMGDDSIIGNLPATPSVYTNPTYWTMTGIRDITGDQKSDVCDDAPVAGLMKGCLVTSVFGRYELATPLLELNRLGQRNDRADPLDLRLIGTPIGSSGAFRGNAGTAAPADVLTNEISAKFFELDMAFHRLLVDQIWNGNPTNNAAAGGYKEMTGIALLVNTGYHDAETGIACAAMDSYVSDFGNRRVDTNGEQLVAYVTNLYRQVKERARRSGVTPVRWAFAMRPDLFYEITAIWPCSYLTYRCTAAGGSTNNAVIDAQDAVRIRDEMRAGAYLLIDGERVEVLLDDAITELDGNSSGGNFPRGCFASDIYLLPFSVAGRSTLYLEYADYQNPSLRDAIGEQILARVEGAFITWPRQTNLCLQWQSKIEPRLVLRTPWLAARLQNVVYCPIEHTREPFPNDPYFVNGGRSSRNGPSFYQLWNS